MRVFLFLVRHHVVDLLSDGEPHFNDDDDCIRSVWDCFR